MISTASLLSSSAPDPNVSDTSSFGSTGSGGAYVVSHQGSASEETSKSWSVYSMHMVGLMYTLW